MNDKNLLVLGAVAVAVFVLMGKKAQAATGAPMSSATPAQTVANKNVNNQMWTSLLGTAWTDFSKTTFTKQDPLSGALLNGMGVPISTDLPALLPTTYGVWQSPAIDFGSAVDSTGADYISQIFDYADF